MIEIIQTVFSVEMPAPGTPKQRTTRLHPDGKQSKPPNPKPTRAPKPKMTTPTRKPGEAPFDVKSLVSKLNSQNNQNGRNFSAPPSPEPKSSSPTIEADSTTITVNDDRLEDQDQPMEAPSSDLESPSETIKHPDVEKLPTIEIPDSVRTAVGPNWRLKEAILNSYHFGAPSVRPIDFARSKLDTKTAEIVGNSNFAHEAKKHAVKMFLG